MTPDEGSECPICPGPRAVILELPASWVTAETEAALPGYVCVVARTHVIEPFDLDVGERSRYFEEVWQTARALREHTEADKINYEIHGNTIRHLHTHLFPRYSGDPFSGRPIDGSAKLFRRTPEQLRDLARALSEAI